MRLIGIHLGALSVAGRGNGDHDVLAGDEVLIGHIAGRRNNFGAAFIAILIDDLCQLIVDNLALALLAGEDILQVGDFALDLRQLVNDLLAFQCSQLAQLHG